MADKNDIKLAKRLARLVVEAGDQGVAELKPALEAILAGRSAKDRKSFLKSFHKAAIREVQKDTLTVESAKPLDAAVLKEVVDAFSKGRERKLHIVESSNPELIAGMRVRIGDTVYDASLANSLHALSAQIR